MKKIFKQSVDLFGKEKVPKEVKEVLVDTTVQEKNITFPTDRNLTEKVIEHCKRIAKKEGIKLKCTYGREIKKLKHQFRFARKPKNMEELDVLYRVLTQKRDDTNKVYSVHEPEVLCISKGKEHKQYEFVNKNSFAYTRKSGIIVGVMAIEGNIYDGRTLKPQLDQVEELIEGKVKKAIVDRGYKVKGGLPRVDIVMPKVLKKESYYLKKKREERCRSRAGIEGLISHLKNDHRMLRNYLSGTAGDQINTLLVAAAHNMKKWMKLKKEEILNLIICLFSRAYILVPINIRS